MGKLVYGYWDCPYCGSTGIRGDNRDCPNCGRPRDDSVKFYMGSNVKYVPHDKAEKVNRNPDWLCNYCNSLNSDSDTHCKSCGRARDEENLTYFENHEKAKATESNTFDDSFQHKSEDTTYSSTSNSHSSDSVNSSRSNSHSSDSVNSSRSNSHLSHSVNSSGSNSHSSFSINWKTILLSFCIIAVIVGGIFLLLPKEKNITVESFSWNRVIEVEKYKWINESAWSLPANAILSYTQEEISSYRDVFDHYETRSRQVVVGYEEYVSGYRDLGNGYFEETTSSRPVYGTEYYQEAVYRSEPVYSTKYYYKIQKWVHERSVVSSGNDHRPYWGTLILSTDERESGRASDYYILGIDDHQKEQKIQLSYDDWNSLEIGQTVKLKISFGFGTIIKET